MYNPINKFEFFKDKKNLSWLKLRGGGKYKNGKIIFVVFENHYPRFIVKQSDVYSQENLIKKEYESLCIMHDYYLNNKFTNIKIPKPICFFENNGIQTCIEECADGHRLNYNSAQENINIVLDCIEELEKINLQKNKYYNFKTILDWFNNAEIDLFDESEKESFISKIEIFLKNRLDSDFNIQACFQHGDLQFSNIVFGEDNKISLIDWFKFGIIDIPTFDIIYFLKRQKNGIKNNKKRILDYFDRYNIDHKYYNFFLELNEIIEYWQKIIYGNQNAVIDLKRKLNYKNGVLRILYLTSFNYLSLKAHVYNTLKTIESINLYTNSKVENFNIGVDLKDSDLIKIKETNNLTDVPVIKNIFGLYPDRKFVIVNAFIILFNNLKAFFVLRSNRDNFDILYFRDHRLFICVFLLKMFCKKESFFESHYTLVSKVSQKITEFCVYFCRGVITISKSLETIYSKIQNNIYTVYCTGIEINKDNDKYTDTVALRKELNLPEDKIILGYAGNLYKTGNNDSYGLEYIINSLPILDKKIIFIGIGKKANETEDLEKLSKDLNVSDRVIFLPFMNRTLLNKYYNSFDVLIVPPAGARPGNSPTKIFEYLAIKKPIVAAKTEAIEEILKDKENALIVSYQDPNSWKLAIETVLQDSKLRNDIINNNAIKCIEYTWENRAKNIIKFIKNYV